MYRSFGLSYLQVGQILPVTSQWEPQVLGRSRPPTADQAMNIVLANSDIAQHRVIQPGKPRTISAVLCETGDVSRRKPVPHQKA
jgi:hypothetical protein